MMTLLDRDHPAARHVCIPPAGMTICGLDVTELSYNTPEYIQHDLSTARVLLDEYPGCRVCYRAYCINCNMSEYLHVAGKCLFLPTKFRSMV